MSSCEMSWAVELLPWLCLLSLPWELVGSDPSEGRGASDPQGVTRSMGKSDSAETRSQWDLRVPPLFPLSPAPLPVGIHPVLAPRVWSGWDVQGHPHVLPGEKGICWILAPFLPKKPLFLGSSQPWCIPGCQGVKEQAGDAWSGGEGWVGAALPEFIPCVR